MNQNYATVLEEQYTEKICEIEDADRNSQYKLSWKLINDISGRKNTRKGQIEGETSEERIKSWYNHFKGLLGQQPNPSNSDEEVAQVLMGMNIEAGPFTKEEYRKAKTAIKEGKSCGEDGIPPEVLKRCDLDEEILKFCNDAILEEKKPEQWSVMNIIPIPKSGDLSKGGNYRGISLCSIDIQPIDIQPNDTQPHPTGN